MTILQVDRYYRVKNQNPFGSSSSQIPIEKNLYLQFQYCKLRINNDWPISLSVQTHWRGQPSKHSHVRTTKSWRTIFSIIYRFICPRFRKKKKKKKLTSTCVKIRPLPRARLVPRLVANLTTGGRQVVMDGTNERTAHEHSSQFAAAAEHRYRPRYALLEDRLEAPSSKKTHRHHATCSRPPFGGGHINSHSYFSFFYAFFHFINQF